MCDFRFLVRITLATFLAVMFFSSTTVRAQSACSFLWGAQRTACQNAAAALAAKKAAEAQKANAEATQPATDATNAPGTTPSTNATNQPPARAGFGPNSPANFPQNNSYRGGIEDCTNNPCTGSQPASNTSDVYPPCNGTLPGMYCYNGTLTDLAQKVLARHNVTADDAIKCNSVYTVASTFKSGGNPAAQNKAALQRISNSVTTNEKYLWDLIYVLSPVVQQAPLATRNNTMTRIRDHQINDDFMRYQGDYQPLLDAYNSCIAKGLPPSGL